MIFLLICLIVYQITTVYLKKDSYLIEISTISNINSKEGEDINDKDNTKLFDFINKYSDNYSFYNKYVLTLKNFMFDKIFIFIVTSCIVTFLSLNDFLKVNLTELNLNKSIYISASLLIFISISFYFYGIIIILEIRSIIIDVMQTNTSNNEFSNVLIKTNKENSEEQDINFISELNNQYKVMDKYMNSFSIWIEFKEKFNHDFEIKESTNIFSTMAKNKSKTDKTLFYVLTVFNSISLGFINGIMLIFSLYYISFSNYSYKIFSFLFITLFINILVSFAFGYLIRNLDFDDKINTSDYQDLMSNIHEDEV